MSATGRGSERRAADYYPTPSWCVRRLLEACPLPGGRWIEPGAGTGSIIRAVNEFRRDVTWTAIELRTECERHLVDAMGGLCFLGGDRIVVADFLTIDLDATTHKVALGNPPFSLAQAFVDRALQAAEQVVFLLRLSFLESQERAAWWQDHPADVFVLPNRPSFTGAGTDATAYGWFRWHKSRRADGVLRVLPLTPDAERKADAMRARGAA